MDWLELSVQASPELVEPLVELFQRYGRRQVVVEEAGGFNPDEGESPPTGGPVIVRAYVMKDRRSADRVARIHAGVQLMGLIKPLSPLAVRTVTPWEWEEAWKGPLPAAAHRAAGGAPDVAGSRGRGGGHRADAGPGVWPSARGTIPPRGCAWSSLNAVCSRACASWTWARGLDCCRRRRCCWERSGRWRWTRRRTQSGRRGGT